MDIFKRATAESSSSASRVDFSSYEQVYLGMSRAHRHLGKEHWKIHCVCAIQSDPIRDINLPRSLWHAWTRLAVEYPRLRIVPDGLQKTLQPFNQPTLLAWTEQTFRISWKTVEQVVAEDEPLDHPTLHFLPSSLEVVFLIEHWRADGLGTCMLLDRLLQLLAETMATSDFDTTLSEIQQEPSPSLEIAAAASTDDDSELQAYAAQYIDRFHEKAVHSGGLPFQGDANTLPSRSTKAEFSYSGECSNKIISACKENSISLSAAIHVALAKTVLDYLPERDREAGCTTVIAVNLRPYLPAPFSGKAHACQTYVGSITPTVPHQSSFLEAASALSYEYKHWWSERFMQSLHWIYKYHLAKLVSSMQRSQLPTPPSGVTLSSLGVVERYIGCVYSSSLAIRTFRFGISMMTRQMILYVWTFKGQLTLSLNYNEAYYSESMTAEVLKRTRENLEEGLNVQ